LRRARLADFKSLPPKSRRPKVSKRRNSVSSEEVAGASAKASRVFPELEWVGLGVVIILMASANEVGERRKGARFFLRKRKISFSVAQICTYRPIELAQSSAHVVRLVGESNESRFGERLLK
jgi:hypothetical protein